MKDLSQIIQALVQVRGESKLKVDDNILFEQAVKLWITNSISDSKNPAKSSQVGQSNSSGQSPKISELDEPTAKQIAFLSRYKVSIPETKSEATRLISRLKER